MLGLKIKQGSAKERRKQRENISNTGVIQDEKLILNRRRINTHNSILAEVFCKTTTKTSVQIETVQM